MINDQGGVNGRKINLVQYYDAYDRPRPSSRCVSWSRATRCCLPSSFSARPRTRRCRNISIPRRCRNCSPRPARCSPTREFSVDDGLQPQLLRRGAHLRPVHPEEYPNAKIGILYQNDDLGKDYLNGIKAGLGDKGAKMIVAEASYEVSYLTIDLQILKIKDAGADLFFWRRHPSRRHRRSRRSPNSAGSRCTSSTSTQPPSALS